MTVRPPSPIAWVSTTGKKLHAYQYQPRASNRSGTDLRRRAASGHPPVARSADGTHQAVRVPKRPPATTVAGSHGFCRFVALFCIDVEPHASSPVRRFDACPNFQRLSVILMGEHAARVPGRGIAAETCAETGTCQLRLSVIRTNHAAFQPCRTGSAAGLPADRESEPRTKVETFGRV